MLAREAFSRAGVNRTVFALYRLRRATITIPSSWKWSNTSRAVAAEKPATFRDRPGPRRRPPWRCRKLATGRACAPDRCRRSRPAGFARIPLALGAMRADGEAMRLVAQPLHEIERRIARRQPERLVAGDEETFAPGVAVGALGDGDDRDVVDAEIGDYASAASNWPLPPSISTRSGPRKGLGVLTGPFALLLEQRRRSGGAAPRASCRNRRRALGRS